ncbi:MAG: hypothetical protein L3J16_06725 [Anaerolineales bacterium]|nr:hypothetical protein [Anaerolineales bacterium]
MKNPVTILAPIKLAAGKTESDLMAASEKFQTGFVDKEPGVLRRELVRTPNGDYLDIVQFRSAEDVGDIMEKEQKSEVCHAFFAVMDMSSVDMEAEMDMNQTLATYTRK